MTPSLAYYVTLLRKDFVHYCNQELQALGLSQGLLFFILHVGKHPGCSPRELSEALGMDTGHVTRTLVKLEQGGFLIQEQNPKDRRAHTLRLVEKGEEAFRVSHELFARWDTEVMAKMPGADREALLALLDTLVERKEGMGCVREAVQPD